MTHFRLISFNLCPFVQRSTITLEEKQVPYEIDYIDLNNKPDWFLDISPFGKVPVLVVDGETVIFESAVINEYLDEVSGGTPLTPVNPLDKATMKAWVEYSSSLIADNFMMSTAATEAETKALAERWRSRAERLERQLGGGPYFLGAEFSLLDAAAAPVLQRVGWCEKIAPELDLFRGLPRIRRWHDALMERPSVKNSVIANLNDVFKEYLQGRGTPTRNQSPSWLGTRI